VSERTEGESAAWRDQPHEGHESTPSRHRVTQRSLPVPDGLDGMRLDQVVSRLFGLSRTAAATLVEAGDALVDGYPRPKSDKVTAGSWLEVTLPAPVTAPAVVAEPVTGLTIVYSDDDMVVVDKPVGVAAHPSPGWTGPTVVGGLAAMGQNVATSGAAERQGIVHRLDVGTTGLMVVAKSELAYSVLKRAFKEREVDKRYHAVVQGHLDPLRGTIDAPIDRHPTADYRYAVMSAGKPSVTHYDTLEAFRAASLVDVKLETGRTHQIRVHFSALRHPCVGDLTYGADPTLAARLKLNRQWLHARELGFLHPRTHDEVRFVSDYPDDLKYALDVLQDAS
jgi:23S rRNA pseudouridine1911/1915/1917 synthase